MAAATTVLAIATATVGLVLLLIILLVGADQERSIELRATRYGSSTDLHKVEDPAKPNVATAQPATSPLDTLRWIRTAAFGVTAVGLLALAANVMHQRRPARSRPVDNWPRAVCALEHRHEADQWQTIRTALGSNIAELVGNRLTVRQVMSATTPLASPNTSIRALKSILASRPQALVAICDSKGHLLGVVGESDLRRRWGTCAADVMTREPYTAPPGARLDAAVTLMLDNQIHSLPIVENGVLRGILTTGDLVTVLDCLLQAIREVSTTVVSHNTDTQTIHNQATRRFPPAPTRQNEPPDTMTSPAAG